uniref:BKRF1 encodes EBNA-1 protein-like n=1 Tax=Oryza sativa subsp. japonica TaxID=39947 RepID=Q5Z552_ORYSJ|nr:BKRF1 encodes EBNA-1 protein-like [Oryza sativa Japonica Group]
MPEGKATTSTGALARNSSRPGEGMYWMPARTSFRRDLGKEEVRTGEWTTSQCRGRWWRRRPAHGRRGRGGRRRNSGVAATVAGGGASPAISPRIGGGAGEEDAPARPREKTARPDGARARRERRLEAGRRRRERRRRRGEVVRPREDAGGG